MYYKVHSKDAVISGNYESYRKLEGEGNAQPYHVWQANSSVPQDVMALLDNSVIKEDQVSKSPAITREDLIVLLTPLFKAKQKVNGAAMKKTFTVRALKSYLKTKNLDYNAMRNPQFAWDLMAVVNQLGAGQQLAMEDSDAHEPEQLDKTAEPIFKKIMSFNWSLRHYTTSETGMPTYNYVGSSAELEVRGIGGKNTRNKDWNKLGNTAFAFLLLCINGIAPKRGFLSKCTHYSEYPITDIPALWISGDLLSVKDKDLDKVKAFKGAGANVKAQLAGTLCGQEWD